MVDGRRESLEAGDAEGIDLPLNTLMADLIRDLEAGKRRQGWENFDLLQSRMTDVTVSLISHRVGRFLPLSLFGARCRVGRDS